MISPPTYNWIVGNQFYDNSKLTSTVTFPCDGGVDAGGSPSPAMSSLVVKLAWMDMTGISDTSTFHTEDLLIYSPSYRVNEGNGPATCELKTMGLVGMHIAHKTQKQQAWVWSTFEHSQNAPDCNGLPPASAPGTAGANTSCPSSVDTVYNFYPQDCPGCTSCNTVPASNDPSGECVTTDSPGGVAWCLDKGPASSKGLSKLCRQVPLSNSAYQPAQDWNTACQGADGIGVWKNYQLISTQWFTGTLSAPSACTNISGSVFAGSVQYASIAPVVSGLNKPYLANTSMESYERSNCMGCHSKSTANEAAAPSPSTDFVYFLGIEVPAAVPDSSAAATAEDQTLATAVSETVEAAKTAGETVAKAVTGQ
jgi:hypothetical protein